MYTPLIATPYSQNDTYIEVLPCEALCPYIKCIWGSKTRLTEDNVGLYCKRLIIPDTCFDIIIYINDDDLSCKIYGIDDTPYYSEKISQTIFAVRFYFWTIPFILQGEIGDFKNQCLDCEQFFPKFKKYLNDCGFYELSFEQRKVEVEKYFIDRIDSSCFFPDLLNAIEFILRKKGNLSVTSLAQQCVISTRTLERIFQSNLGVAPKEIFELIRYQYLWRDVLTERTFNIHDEVYKLGFYDQPHLLNTFRKYHGLTMKEAITLGQKDCRIFPRQVFEKNVL